MVPELPEIVNGIQFALQNNISLRYKCYMHAMNKNTRNFNRLFSNIKFDFFFFAPKPRGGKLHCRAGVHDTDSTACTLQRPLRKKRSILTITIFVFNYMVHYIIIWPVPFLASRMLDSCLSSVTFISGPASSASFWSTIFSWMENATTFRVSWVFLTPPEEFCYFIKKLVVFLVYLREI